MLTEKQILKFNPIVNIGGTKLKEYFIISKTQFSYTIRNGLRNGDLDLPQSPYFYEKTIVGKNCKKQSLIEFNNFLKTVKNES